MRTGTLRPRSLAWASMAVICCLFPSTRKTRWRVRWGSRRPASSNADAIMSSMLSVTEADTHLFGAFRAGVRLAACVRGGDVLGLADGGGEVGDGDDLGHLLDPGVRAFGLLPGVL